MSHPPQPPYGHQQPSHWQPPPQGYPTRPAHSYQPGPPQPQRGLGLIVAVLAAAVSVIVLVVVAVIVLRPSGTGPGTATSTPTSTPTPSSTATTAGPDDVTANHQFANGDDGGWGCTDNCRFADGRLHLSSEIEPEETSVDWWHRPGSDWLEGNVQKSTVTVEDVSFDGYGPRSLVGIKCGARVLNGELTDAFQVELRGDGEIQFFELVGGTWQESGESQSHRGDARNPGEVTFTCEDRGPDYRIALTLPGFETERIFPGVDRRGTTLMAYGGYGEPGERVGFSTTGVRYVATPSP